MSSTFSLVGFSTIRREGIELVSGFTAKVDADMRVGALEETLTVSGQSPVVDVQNASQTKVVSNEMLFALPLTKEMGGLAKVTVGVMIPPTAQDVGGNIDPMNAYPVIHGGKTGDNRALLDGMQFNGEGQGRGFYFNPSAAQEASVQLGGQTAEFENGGFQANMVPKDGGNRFTGLFSANYANDNMVSDNLTQELQDRGLRLVNTTKRTYDANGAVGGPIFRDRLWFFGSHRVFGYQNYLAGNWSNLTQNTPLYTPDLSRPAIHQQDNVSDGIRLTYQLSRKDKISAAWDLQHSDICLGCSPLVAPEATYLTKYADPNYLLQFKWSRVMSNRFYFEAADSTLIFNWPNRRKPEAQGISILNGNTGFRYNAPLASSLGQRVASQSNQRASLSYVTGSHAFKVGFTTQEAWHHAWYDDGGPAPGLGAGLVAYTFLNNRPSQITQYAEPVTFDERLKVNLGMYVQDQWTLRRLTLNLGLRYDYFNAYVPAQSLAAGPFVPARSYDKVECVPCWQDISPRMAAAYDVFGNGRTAIKFNVGRYVAADIYTQARANNPVTRAVLNASRTWTDSNNNFSARLRSAEPERAKPVGERRRRLRRAQQRQLREEQSQCDDLRRRYADRIRGPLAQLADADHVRSAAASQHLAGSRLLPDRVERLLRHPEHRGEPGAGRLYALLCDGACQRAAARRRRLSDLRCLRRGEEQVRPDHQRRLTCADGEWQPERGLQRVRRRAEHPAGAPRQHQWRVEHRPDHHQQLRADADEPAVRKRQHPTYPRTLRDRAAMVGIDAGQVLRGVPAAVGFPGRDDLPESARHHVWCQRHVHQCAGCRRRSAATCRRGRTARSRFR